MVIAGEPVFCPALPRLYLALIYIALLQVYAARV